MRVGKWIALLLVTVMICSSVFTLVFADEPIGILLNQRFDDVASGSVPDAMKNVAGKPRVIDETNKNKSLYLGGDSASVWFPCTKLPNDYMVLLVDVKNMTDRLGFQLGTSKDENSNSQKLLRVEENRILTIDGKCLGGLQKNEYVNIKMVFNMRKNVYDIYLNNQRQVQSWKLSGNVANGIKIDKDYGAMSIDNLIVCQGKNPDVNAPGVVYNNDGEDYVEYDYSSNSDKIIMDTDYISDVWWNRSGTYAYTAFHEKTNKIIANRLTERYNGHRENAWLTIQKTTSSDSHIDFDGISRERFGVFPYYTFRGKVKMDVLGSRLQLAIVRDTATTGGNQDANILTITENGSLIINNTGQVLKTLNAGEWLDYAVCMDMKNHTAKVYIDDKTVVENIGFNQNVNIPNMVRVWMEANNANCTAVFDRYRIIGMRHEYDPENTYQYSAFSDDSGIEAYLSDKIVFHGYSKNVFSGGEKHIRGDMPVVKDDIVYVTSDAVNLGYGFNLTADGTKAETENLVLTANSSDVVYKGEIVTMEQQCFSKDGKFYIPVASFAEKVLGHQVVTDGNGLVVTSNKPFRLSNAVKTPEYLVQAQTYYPPEEYSNIKVINWYMQFERPDKERLQEEFNKATDNGAMHPRVCVTKRDFDRMRSLRNTDKDYKEITDSIILKADSYIGKEKLEYVIPDKQRLLEVSREALTRTTYLGFAYQMTGDKKYSDACREVLMSVTGFSDWNPSHLIDQAEMLASVAIGYDWIYDALNDEDRSYFSERTVKLGLADARDFQYNLLMIWEEWANAAEAVDAKTNFNTVIDGGMIMAACAFTEYAPELCFDIIQKALRSIEYTIYMYEPEGVWGEGNGYWDFATGYLVKAISSVINSTGSDYGMLDARGVRNTALYLRSVNGPMGVNNFHDMGAGRVYSSALGFLAKHYNNPTYYIKRRELIMQNPNAATVEDCLWYHPKSELGEDDVFDLDILCRGLDTVSSRSSYEDDNAFFFSVHGGHVFGYHTHGDVASFVLDYKGVRWAADLGAEDYNLRRDAGAAGDYIVYRDRPEAHNLMVFNPEEYQGMDFNAAATLTRWESRERGCIAAYDLASVWSKYVSKYQRGYQVTDDRTSLVTRDEFTPKQDMPVYWFMTTPADVTVADNSTAFLKAGGTTMKLEVISDIEDYNLSVGPAQPLETSPQIAGQNENKGYSRIAVKLNAKGNIDQSVTVKISPYNGETASVNNYNAPISEWSIPDGTYIRPRVLPASIYVNGVNLQNIITDGTVSITEGEPMPVITAVAEDPANKVEIISGNPQDSYTIVRISTPDGSYYDYSVIYKKSESADLGEYENLGVANVTVSSTPEAENSKNNMLDNNFSTRWTSANSATTGENAIFELEDVQQIDGVAIAFWRGDTRNYLFDIYVSEDGDTWTKVTGGQSNGKTEGLEKFTFDSIKARYVKFVGAGNTVNGHSNILEFKILRKK